MNHRFVAFRLERYSRRSTWSSGSPVYLADGERWYLPDIRDTLPVLMSELRGDFQAALEIASRRDSGSNVHGSRLAELVRYHGHMAAIGCRLLQKNYELPDFTWKSLLTFNDLPEMFNLTLMISSILAEETAVWEPLL